MSPITHALIGWTLSQPLTKKRDRCLATVAAIVPDIDGLTLLGGVDLYHEFHHTFGHNIFFGFMFSAFSTWKSPEQKKVFLLGFLSFHSHLVCDLLGSGADWGIYYLWPASRWEITSFPPFQWELESWQNIITTVIFMIIVMGIGIKKRRTIVELFSTNADEKFVAILRKWSGRN